MPSSTDSAATDAPPTRLKLTMPSPTHSANLEGLAAPQNFGQNAHQNSFRRPSCSPMTFTFPGGASGVGPQKIDEPEVTDEPDPLPISLDENSDAIALKAALSILQLQRQQSQRDIKQLDKMKAAANNEPEAFVDALKAGKLSKAPSQTIVNLDDEESEGEDRSGEAKPDHKVANSENPHHDFGQFPNPQSVVRCPPVNWAKYHVVGASLDRLHEEHRHRPEPGHPGRDEDGKPPEHVIAAPYRPFVDKLEPAPRSMRSERKE
jgi:hypothetical protein